MDGFASFGYWLRRRRKALDLTQEALARQIGCAVITIQKIEADERRPSRQIAEKLAECLTIPPEERAAFVKAARAEVAVDRLDAPFHTPRIPLAPPDTCGPRPKLLKGYELREQVGSGRFGVVDCAHHPGVGRQGAVKIILPEHADQTTPSISVPRVRSNLPAQLTNFIGREKELAELKQLLTPLHGAHAARTIGRAREGNGGRAARLVTLTGPGGTGKTRLSLEAAAELIEAFPHGVWLVELAPLGDPALVPCTVAATLDVREEPGRPILATLIDSLRARKILLILDNCEHVIDASAQLAEALLRACADAHILASSREALGIAGELAYRVPSLAVPDPRQAAPAEALLRYESVQLFVDRAAMAWPSFDVIGENVAAIAQICHRLDGIPLAIELAAARITVLRVEQIAARLADTFRLLTGGSRTALPRQQTLRATIDWSYNLLSEAERALLRRLSVFAGGWTIEAAEAVIGDWRLEIGDSATNLQSPISVLDGLATLVNKSLVIADREPGEDARYRVLETIRQYAREKLLEVDEGEAIGERHLAYFLALAERAEPELTGPNQVAWMNRLELELDNLRAALGWAVERHSEAGLRLASALWRFWDTHGYVRDGCNWLAQLLMQPEAIGQTAVRAKALSVQSDLMIDAGDFGAARALAVESLALYRELGDRHGIAFSLATLGGAACLQDDYAVGRPLIMESLALCRDLGFKLGIAALLRALTFFVTCRKNYMQARAYLEERLAIYRELGHLAGIGASLSDLGMLSLRQGDLAQARQWLEESLAIQHRLGNRGVSFGLLNNLGELALHERNYEQARAYLEESLALSQETGQYRAGLWAFVRLGYVALRQGNVAHARAVFAESQQQFNTAGSKIGVVFASEGLASLAVMRGHAERAVRLFAWTDAMRAAISDQRPPVEQGDVDHDFAIIGTQLDETTIAAAHAEGRTMTIEQAIADALELV